MTVTLAFHREQWDKGPKYYNDIIISAMASPASRLFTQPFIQGADQRKHYSSASLPFVRGIHRGPVNSPLKGPVTREMFPFEGVIMIFSWLICELRIRSVLHFDILCHVQYCAIPDQVRIMTKIICIRQYCTMTYGEPQQLLPFLCIKVTKISLASIGWLPFAGKQLQDWKPHCYIFESFAVTYIDIRAIIKNEQCPSHTFDTIWPTLKYSHARFCL